MSNAAEFLGLRIDVAAQHGALAVTEHLGGGRGQLFGGAALGAAALLAEAVTERPVAWMTAQFLANAFPPELLSLDATVAVHGRAMSQVTVSGTTDGVTDGVTDCVMEGASDDRSVFTVSIATGRRSFRAEQTWGRPPRVPAPESCPPRDQIGPAAGRLHERAEQFLAELGEGNDPTRTGRSAMWIRFPDGLAGTVVGQAIAGDLFPSAVRQALAVDTWGASLDNTLRVVRTEECEWVLADMAVHGVVNGLAHGEVRLWSRAGSLLGIASQTCTVTAPSPGVLPEG